MTSQRVLQVTRIIVLLNIFILTWGWETPDNLQETYFGTIERERPYKLTEIEGEIPEWIEGYFLHQTGGTYGNQSNTERGAKITHTFDALGTVASFKMSGGQAEFGTRFYLTHSYKVWDYYERDMDRSKVAWNNVYTLTDQEQYKKWSSFDDYIKDNPNVAFWKIGDNVEAMAEGIAGVWIDLETLETKGYYPFTDENLGFPPYMTNINNPAHEHYDADGVTVYSSAFMFDLSNSEEVNAWRVLYKIEDDERITIAQYLDGGPFNLNQCVNDNYPEYELPGGYLHSFCLTEHYFVIPTSTFILDVCKTFVTEPDDPIMPFFLYNYNFTTDLPTRFVVISRDTNEVVGEFSTPEGLFITHQLNSYELDGKMYLDMLTYNWDVYHHMNTKDFVEGPGESRTVVERFVVNMSDWTLIERIDLYPSGYQMVEFSTINYDLYNAKPYRYAYMVGFDPVPNSLIKLNVETKEAIYWGPYDNLLPGEPIFVSTPGAVDEDDGVILANVLDTESATGMVVILDGKTFTEIGRAISPELMPFGLHSKFIQQKVDIADPGISSSTYKRASHVVSSVCLFLVIFVQIVI